MKNTRKLTRRPLYGSGLRHRKPNLIQNVDDSNVEIRRRNRAHQPAYLADFEVSVNGSIPEDSLPAFNRNAVPPRLFRSDEEEAQFRCDEIFRQQELQRQKDGTREDDESRPEPKINTQPSDDLVSSAKKQFIYIAKVYAQLLVITVCIIGFGVWQHLKTDPSNKDKTPDDVDATNVI